MRFTKCSKCGQEAFNGWRKLGVTRVFPAACGNCGQRLVAHRAVIAVPMVMVLVGMVVTRQLELLWALGALAFLFVGALAILWALPLEAHDD